MISRDPADMLSLFSNIRFFYYPFLYPASYIGPYLYPSQGYSVYGPRPRCIRRKDDVSLSKPYIQVFINSDADSRFQISKARNMMRQIFCNHDLWAQSDMKDIPIPATHTFNIRRNPYDPCEDGRKPWIYHLKSVWLFTYSDLKTIIVPKTAFGVLNALYAPGFGICSNKARLPRTVLVTAFWAWANLLPFTIDNQRQAASIAEDRLNKPWRPLPSERLTPEQAKRLMFVLYPVAAIVSSYLGGLRQCLALMVLGYWYNHHGGAANCVARNAINACGFVCYASGAMEVALGASLPLNLMLVQWFLIISAVVFSTVQTQDLYDQAGDRVCGRKTLPLVVGDSWSRWMTALPMVFWTLFCPWFWTVRFGLSMIFSALGAVIVVRLLVKREVRDDKKTFKMWNIWMVFMYLLPLLRHAPHS